jgi:hypothetical protein
MRNKRDGKASGGLRPEYDFAKMKGGVRGKYARLCRKGSNLVLLAPDVAKVFHDEESVNAALRTLIRASNSQ